MSRILLTGGRGGLGSELWPRLARAGYTLRIASRRARHPGELPEVEWAQMSLESGEGLAEALTGADTIIHCASSPFVRTRQIEVNGTRRLLEEAERQRVGHFLYISIVGVDRIPYGYYQAKFAAEQVVERGGVPWTILRATQFHSLLDLLVAWLARWPIHLRFAGFQFQTIETGEVADRMVELVAAGPAGRAPDIGGPEVLTIEAMWRTWAEARHSKSISIALPIPGAVGEGFRRGYNACPDRKYGRITWAEWVRQKYALAEQRDRDAEER